MSAESDTYEAIFQKLGIARDTPEGIVIDLMIDSGWKVPAPGEPYYDGFESDYTKSWGGYGNWTGRKKREFTTDLTIRQVYSIAIDGCRPGFLIQANNNIGYDCFWSERLKAWVYSLD